MSLFKNGLLGGGILLSICSSAMAEIKLPAFFSDRMVLQRETSANIWGWADAGQSVKVSFAGKSVEAKADKTGKWKVAFKNLKASKKGASMTIEAGAEKKTIQDVIVGEVWLASGQSNMEWPVAKSTTRKQAATAQDDLLRVYVSGNRTAATELTDFPGRWMATKPGQTLRFTAVGYEFAKVLREKLDVPVGVIECSWGGKPVESFISEEAIKLLPEAKLVLDRKAKAKLKQGARADRNPALHSTIYNGMIAPLVGYSVRGAIWYQGESNARHGTGKDYGELLECMIKDWRKRWGSNMSFYYVQLANFQSKGFPEWVTVQDEMRRLLDDEDMQAGSIGMATVNEIGAGNNIHPPNKVDVGSRLARWALNKDYGMKDVVVSGPLYRSHVVRGDKLEISFVHAKGLKTRDSKPLGTFQIAGTDGKWKPAEATIKGEVIIVSSKEVSKPVKARYAWSPMATGANLVNAEGLPTSCFVTK